MSGIDEQRVSQCPACKRSHEINVGNSTWMFPEDARLKRKLKYMLYSCRNIGDNLIPQFYSNGITCQGCGKKYNAGTTYYNMLKKLFDRCIRREEYYKGAQSFREDDDMSGWYYNRDMDVE